MKTDPYAALRTYFEQRAALSEEEFAVLRQLFRPRTMQRHEVLHLAGEVASYGAFVARGCLRAFVVDAQGKEHILQFAPEQWWIAEQHSLRHHAPALFAIDAVEDSEVLLYDALFYHQPGLPTVRDSEMTIAMLTNRIYAMQQRLVLLLSAPAKVRYLDFLQTYPTLAQRLPLRLIAAYLGITPESLSRVRHELAHVARTL
ncbi:Crp/Fnr family transcriptional regulator [Hymenobacter terricola]|uniref:Crp/Fnr family transcriptional regulator n=1 Tax=Hymenobacter terricola TaxID=2819236 RepID=UPI001B301122|nr:Crp/Fnr family transcriptional regulator [Hymenobacter terricola]